MTRFEDLEFLATRKPVSNPYFFVGADQYTTVMICRGRKCSPQAAEFTGPALCLKVEK